jgi:hypothetical protein
MNGNVPIRGFLRVSADGLLLRVKLQPRASTNEILGPMGDELRIRVTAPPVDAAAKTPCFASSPTGWIARARKWN